MKSMLVLIGGGPRDRVVFQTALAAARPLSAHMDCLHIHVTLGESAREVAIGSSGSALLNAINRLQAQSGVLAKASKAAADNIRELCADGMIELRDGRPDANTPSDVAAVTASFRQETDKAIERLTLHARNSDLVVMGRRKQTQGLPENTLEYLILRCGRPMLLAGTDAPKQLDTIMVCWKKSDQSARVVAAATPLLTSAKRVVFATVGEPDAAGIDALDSLARQFAVGGVQTAVKIAPPSGRRIADALSAAADECAADLAVMGAYGRPRALEFLFGSCTQDLMMQSDKAILLLH